MHKHEITGFENHHQHTSYSLLDGFATVAEYAKRAKEINYKHLTISDHGVLGSTPELLAECEKYQLHPHFAIEMYINPLQPKVANRSESAEFRKNLSPEEQKIFDKSYHLLCIAYNNVGYTNLVKLSSWSWIHGYYKRPRINHEILAQHKEGLVFTSSCAISEVANAFFKGGDEAGFAMVEKYMALGGEHFYLEMMLLDFKLQKPYNSFLIRAHEKYKLPLIITLDAHYSCKEESKNQRMSLLQKSNKTLADMEAVINSGEGEDMFELQDENLWLKSEEELNEKWEKDYQEIIDYEIFKQAKKNTVILAEFTKGVELDREIKLPKIPDADDILWEEVKKGYVARKCPRTVEYTKRIREEYNLIKEKDFSSYFLIKKMMVDEARDYCEKVLGFPPEYGVGCGRGCLHPDTFIVMGDGKYKKISSIQEGDFVFTIDGTPQVVEKVFCYNTEEELIFITTEEGIGVGLTLDHKVLAEFNINHSQNPEMFWTEAGLLKPGDYCFYPKTEFCDCNEEIYYFEKKKLIYGKQVVIESVQKIKGKGKVYDLQISNNRNYLTSDFIVHNSVCGSLLAYCIGLHDIDSIHHDLKFSRFLNPSRGGKQMKIKHSIQPIPRDSI